MKTLQATIEASGEVLARRVQVADTLWTRFWGLMGKRAVAPDEGLLIMPCYSVHTMFMRFPIDVIYLDDDCRILKVADSMKPFRASMRRGSRSVLEMRAGSAVRAGLSVGAQIVFTEVRDAHRDPEHDSRSPAQS